MEICPYHKIEPEYQKIIYRKKLEFKGYKPLPELSRHRFFCPACEDERELGECRPALAAGFTSVKSKAQAAKNWDNGVKNASFRIFKKAVRGS